jgi:hypothetical protein
MAFDSSTTLPGVFARHEDDCPVRTGGMCTCAHLRYRGAYVPPGTNRRLLSPEFDSAANAQAWQYQQAQTQQQQEQEREVTPAASLPRIGRTLGRVIDAFVQETGRADGGGDPGRPSTDEQVREFRETLSYVDEDLRSVDIGTVRYSDIQRLIDQLWEAGLSAGRIRSVTQALAAVYAYAIPRGLVDHSPVVNLVLPRSDNANGAQPHPAAESDWPTPHFATPPPVDTTRTGFELPDFYPPPPDHAALNGSTAPGYSTPPPGYAPAPGHSTPPPGYTPIPGYPPAPGYSTPPPGYTPPAPMGYPTQEYRPFAPEYSTPPPGYVTPNVTNGFQGGYSTPPAQGFPGSGSPNGYFGQGPLNGDATGSFASHPGLSAAGAEYDATMQERFLWWTVRIIVIVFVLIALVLVAESV